MFGFEWREFWTLALYWNDKLKVVRQGKKPLKDIIKAANKVKAANGWDKSELNNNAQYCYLKSITPNLMKKKDVEEVMRI